MYALTYADDVVLLTREKGGMRLMIEKFKEYVTTKRAGKRE